MHIHSCISMLSDKTIQVIQTELTKRMPTVLAMEDLLTKLGNQEYIHQLWTRLYSIEQEAVILFLHHSAKGFLKKKEWELLVQQKNPQLSFGLTGLCRLGLVYTVRKIWSEVGYLMPAEVRRAFARVQTLDSNRTLPSHQAPRREVLSYYIPSGRGIHLDLFACLLNIREHPVTLTQKRTVQKRSLQKLTAGTSILSEHIKGWYESAFPSDIRKVYSPQEAFLLDLLLRLRLCQWEGKQLALSLADVTRFMTMESTRRNEILLDRVLSSYVPAEPWLEAAMNEITRTDQSDWQSIEQLHFQLTHQGYQLPDHWITRLKDIILHPLLGCGFLEVGEADSHLYWRKHSLLSNPRQTEDFWYVEPTGTILAGVTISLARLWELSELASLEFSGEMIHCTLQADKVQSYLSAGGTEEQILDLLQRGCPYPIPEPVRDQVAGWAKDAKQIRFQPVVRVSTAHPQLLSELRMIPLLEPYLQEVISDTDFLIVPERQEALILLLKQCGFEPRQGIIHPAAAPIPLKMDTASEAGIEDLGVGLCSLSIPWEGYRIENGLPERPADNPQFKSLPKMWTQHAQSYHSQTLRDMLKRAEELKLQVYLQLTSGEEWEGIPERVEIEMGYWMITLEIGRRKQKIGLEEITRIKLILPEYI